jgi:uncharacterized protein (TIGR02466 family)
VLSREDTAASLIQRGRAEEALELIEGEAKRPGAPYATLACYSNALKALQRMDECATVRRQAALAYPTIGVAWHNLASILGDLGSNREAIESCERGFAAGLDAPETWLVYARALAYEGQPTAALDALSEALSRRGEYPEALTEKARLIWSMTGDAQQAIAVFPRTPAHALGVAGILRQVGHTETALAILQQAASERPGDISILLGVANAALEVGDVDQAEQAAFAARRLAPSNSSALEMWAITSLATGKVDEALSASRLLLDLQPTSQAALAMRATAARMAGSPEYGDLYDYDALVSVGDIAAPPGWDSREGFLVELSAVVSALHQEARTPLGQSLRHGTQTTQDLRVSRSPVIKAFFAAIDPLIRAHIEKLGPGDDPVRKRRREHHAISGCWSIQLSAGGHHVDHMHPRGWLSSAFYVDVPADLQNSDAREGWLQFGKPSFPTSPAIAADHFVQPVPGRLVLFPSYMWHGTVPFWSPSPRTTIAFDVVPA